MTSGHRKKALAFGLSCLVTAGAWILRWPENGAPGADTGAAVSAPTRDAGAREPLDVKSILQAIDRAETQSQRVAAAERLIQVPRERIQEVLESIPLKDDNHLSLAARVLLIRWGSVDGEAALNWSWRRFRSESQWDDAFRQIGPSWAWSDPKGFGRWLESKKSDDVTLAMAEASDEPLVDFMLRRRALEWLTVEDPVAAYRVGGLGGLSSEINRVEPIREILALMATGEIKDPTPVVIGRPPEMPLLARWKQIDPESFAASPYAAMLAERQAAGPTPFESWKAASSDERAATIETVLEGQSGRTRSSSLEAMIRVWADDDPAAVEKWVLSAPGADGRAAAVYAEVLAGRDTAAALDWAGRLPPAQRYASVLTVFDVWREAHPGARPDLSACPPEVRQAWEDLEALSGG